MTTNGEYRRNPTAYRSGVTTCRAVTGPRKPKVLSRVDGGLIVRP